MVALQNELRSIKCDLGEMKVTNSTLNTNNCLTNVHDLQLGNLPMPQHPPISYTDQISNNPPSQASVVRGPDEAVSQCKDGCNSNK